MKKKKKGFKQVTKSR